MAVGPLPLKSKGETHFQSVDGKCGTCGLISVSAALLLFYLNVYICGKDCDEATDCTVFIIFVPQYTMMAVTERKNLNFLFTQ